MGENNRARPFYPDSAETSFNVAYDELADEFYRTDSQERLQKARSSLYGKLAPAGSKSERLSLDKEYYPTHYLAFHLNLEDAEVPSFVNALSEYFSEVTDQNGNVLGYKINDVEKLILHLGSEVTKEIEQEDEEEDSSAELKQQEPISQNKVATELLPNLSEEESSLYQFLIAHNPTGEPIPNHRIEFPVGVPESRIKKIMWRLNRTGYVKYLGKRGVHSMFEIVKNENRT